LKLGDYFEGKKNSIFILPMEEKTFPKLSLDFFERQRIWKMRSSSLIVHFFKNDNHHDLYTCYLLPV